MAKMTPEPYLYGLAQRLMHVPAMYGVDQSDVDRLTGLARKLAEAEWLIRELCSHEGAEGWSLYLNERLAKYEFETPPST